MRLITCVSVLLLSLSAAAATTNYTVKQAGGGNFTTIQACIAAMVPGDTCTVYAGTYNEHVTVSAGTAGAYKTLQVNGTDLVYVLDFTLNSHNKVIGFQIQSSVADHDCVYVSADATDVFITGNHMTGCGLPHAAISGGTNSSYVYIQNNTIIWPASPFGGPTNPNGAIAIQTGNIGSHHWLIENNSISHVSDFHILVGDYNVIRNNKLGPTSETDCSAVCHTDGVQASASETMYTLIEGNTLLNNLGPNGHFSIFQAYACNGLCHDVIIRYNIVSHVGAAGIEDDNGIQSSIGYYNLKAYNNTWVDLGTASGGILNAWTWNSYNGSEINDLFFWPSGLPTGGVNPFACDDTRTGGSTCSTFRARNNLGWCASGYCRIYGEVYQNGNFTDTTSASSGNIIADPLFVGYSATDLGNLNLSPASPAIAAGTYLTTVAAGDLGSGTTLVVNDAAFFQDGHGLPGVKADQIRVGTTTVAQIVSVNYSSNTLTLASSIPRSAGNPVFLFSDSTGRIVLSGNAPDLGAYPSGLQQVPTPPSGLTVSVT